MHKRHSNFFTINATPWWSVMPPNTASSSCLNSLYATSATTSNPCLMKAFLESSPVASVLASL